MSLELKKDFIEAIETCPWFENCGKNDDLIDFDIIYINNLKELKKCITKLKWSNLTLEKYNNFTFYLSVNHNEWYNKNWNTTVIEFNNKYINKLFNEKVKRFKDVELQKAVLDDVEWNMIHLFMINIYSDYYHDEFLEKLLKIYLAGHLPCGWQGSLKEGKFLVY